MPRYPTRETYAMRACVLCGEGFKPERWDQSYCGTLCATKVNRFLAGKVLEAARAIECQNKLCWNCGIVKYPDIYLAIIRPWMITGEHEAIQQHDYVALCSTCKLPVRLMLALGAFIDLELMGGS
jgi:hypothetical protein